MFSRSLALLPVALTACSSEQAFEQRPARMAFGPALLDLGDVPIGSVATADIHVDHLDGPEGTLHSVLFQDLSGSGAFVYEGPQHTVVERGALVLVPVTFAPTEEGWFSARVSIVHNGLDSPATLDVRGHGVVPDAALSPLVVDFGEVPVGGTAYADVVLTNTSELELAVTELHFSNDPFTTEEQAPFTLDGGDRRWMTLAFTPTREAPTFGEFTVKSGGIDRWVVQLRGNDCEDGVPEAYDRDEDGVTSCGGDCDDGRDDVRPGRPELEDGADNDCDGEVDEGTPGADDDRDGASELAGDCDDQDAAIGPQATEVPANGRDDDCDGVVDSGTQDLDLDGYDPVLGGDCDDTDPAVHPGAPEVADGVDQDCDDRFDEGTPAYDDDLDGFCELAAGCTDGSTGGDCDDTDAAVHPNAAELPDRRDDDCDGRVDEGTTAADDDGDGYTELGGDCDDTNVALNPGQGTCP